MPDSHTVVARKAAELIALYDALAAVRRNGGIQMADLAMRFVTALAEAREDPRIYRQAPPTQFLGRGLTLLVRRNHGHFEACLTPNHYREEVLDAMLEKGDAGMFHRPEDWADTRYFDSFHGAFCRPAAWSAGCEAGRGLIAVAAHAAHERSSAAADALAQNMVQHDDSSSARELIDSIRQAAGKIHVQDRTPAVVPIRILRVASEHGLGYGETLAFWLYADSWGPGLSGKQVAFLLGINTADQVRKMSRSARRKLPSTKTLMRLVPPWPAASNK